ncbi:hypothetical protein L211DRAFT_419980 [Terfezia boudieri ATCC MYA-4762]|uniref:Uncharacterized protein n=1 Tax=Terfezia boudieri ATCC MYA-4762 TaxID=1051890 RepID=A0A3N4LFP3_9PEZI|nr:hypothetical protein L211DRAFT_419980 [Terfezia boudieri ATCC MYA-4762]
MTSRKGRSNVIAEIMQTGPAAYDSGWPEVNPAFLYIHTYPVSSFWLFEQYSKFEVQF